MLFQVPCFLAHSLRNSVWWPDSRLWICGRADVGVIGEDDTFLTDWFSTVTLWEKPGVRRPTCVGKVSSAKPPASFIQEVLQYLSLMTGNRSAEH